MSSFLTQCPHCLTSFRVTDTQLEAAEGLVRCGACLGIFSAAANRITLKQTPEEAAAAAAAREAGLEEFDEVDAGLDGEEPDTENFEEPGEAAEYAPAEFVLPDEAQDALEADARGAADEEERVAASVTAEDPDADLLHEEDFDVPLGDLNLDGDAEPWEADDYDEEGDDEEQYDDETDDEGLDEDDAEDEFDASDGEELFIDDEEEEEETNGEPDATEEFDEEEPSEEIYDEYADEESAEPSATVPDAEDEAEDFIPEISFDDADDDDVEEDDEELYADAEQALAAIREPEFDDDGDDDDVEPLIATPTPQHRNDQGTRTDKAALRRYLADVEDDEALDPLDDEALDTLDDPVTLDTAPRRSWLVGFGLLLANMLLAGLLAWQYVGANIDALSRSSRFAALLPYACRVVECPAPDRSQVELFVSEQLLVRSHPRYAEALEVSLVFRNDATEAQPFPALELGFHDPANRLVANRLFKPAEYLPMELRASEMPAQSSLQVTLELLDPGSDAVNYTLVFRAP